MSYSLSNFSDNKDNHNKPITDISKSDEDFLKEISINFIQK
jgi:hypothetical protein